MHTHDLHAAMLPICCIERNRLNYRYQGCDVRLVDVFGSVAKGILV